MRSYRLQFYLIGIWFVFTIALASWWLYFALTKVEHGRHTKMLVYEGSTLLLMLTVGAAVLTYFVNREMQERKKLQQFFAALSHEIKTPLSSVNLDIEVLEEKLVDQALIKPFKRIRSNIGKLSLQLENSLFLADQETDSIILEEISLIETLESVKPFFQTLNIKSDKDCKIKADRRALVAIISNIFANAVKHGEAGELTITTKTLPANKVEISFLDNGKGFKGDLEKLAKPFVRHYAGSGSGIGLFLVQKLAKKMGGQMLIEDCKNGFNIKLTLQT